MPGKRRTRPRESEPKRRSHSRSTATSDYERCIQQADDILAKNDQEPRDDNWREVALEWFGTHEPGRALLADYIAEHEDALDIAWAREMLRMEVFFQANDHEQIIAHYDRVLSRYPRCAVLEMWVADHIFRYQGDCWRARSMYRYAQEKLPQHPKTYYEIGFMNHLLGDLPGSLWEFNRAAERISGYDDELAARVFYNRAVVRYALEGDKDDAIADLERALEYRPDYPRAKAMLRQLRGRWWLPW